MCAFGDLSSGNYYLVSGTYVAQGVPQSRGSAVVTCVTPAYTITAPTAVPVSLSVDGGNTFVAAPQPFTYDFALIECDELIISSANDASTLSQFTLSTVLVIAATTLAALML